MHDLVFRFSSRTCVALKLVTNTTGRVEEKKQWHATGLGSSKIKPLVEQPPEDGSRDSLALRQGRYRTAGTNARRRRACGLAKLDIHFHTAGPVQCTKTGARMNGPFGSHLVLSGTSHLVAASIPQAEACSPRYA